MRLGLFIATYVAILAVTTFVLPGPLTWELPVNGDAPRPSGVRCLALSHSAGQVSPWSPAVVVLDTAIDHSYRGRLLFRARYYLVNGTEESWASWAPAGDSLFVFLEDEPALHLPAHGDTLRGRKVVAWHASLFEAFFDQGSPVVAIPVHCAQTPAARAPD